MELLKGVALGDPLRAEGHVNDAPTRREVLRHVCGRTRIDGAPKRDESALSKMWRDLVDRLLEDRHRRPEELVHRRTDDDHKVVGPLDHRATRPEAESTGRQDL